MVLHDLFYTVPITEAISQQPGLVSMLISKRSAKPLRGC